MFAPPTQINALPPEILSPIFITVVDASLYARSVGDNSYGVPEYPTLISSVCAYWRRVSFGIPYLWTYIDLMPGNERPRNAEHVKLWLERSQNSPLRIRIGKGGEDDEEREKEESAQTPSSILPRHLDRQLYSLLCFSAPRVHSFTLKFTHLDLAKEALSALLPDEGEHPIRELALRQSRWASPRRSRLLPQNEWDRLLEPLHVLRLERCSTKFSAIPCRNLVELRIIYPSARPSLVDFVRVLESNPGLHTLAFSMFSSVAIPPNSVIRSIQLPSIRRISFSMSREFITWFFNLLAPGSHELDLRLACSGTPETNDTSLEDTMIFFQQNQIRSLYLQAEAITLPPILASLPRLQILGLSTFSFSASTLAGLDPTSDVLPKLHTIDLNECTLENYSDLDPGLHALLSLPSVRRIRHLNCGDWEVEGSRERFVKQLEGGGFAAKVIYTPASDIEERASPFR
ncbi:hypothetical protein BDV93DRAFT_559464 [Ceratobasidium sp. AG-I]|nr:hypothetical protein BDV93DRAFT_559464 [Ceratobasidium sp. AG-I]